MAVAEIEHKSDKAVKVEPGLPGWLSGAFGWGPRKFRELKTFLSEVRAELRKVTWPSRNEVYTTTIVVIATTVFFGFYLYSLDLVMSQLFSLILK